MRSPGGSDDRESACNAGDQGLIPGSGRPPGKGNGTSLQYSCLENPWTEEPAELRPWGCKQLDTINTFFHFFRQRSVCPYRAWGPEFPSGNFKNGPQSCPFRGFMEALLQTHG